MFIKCLLIPFLGVVFSYLSSLFITNRAIIFTAFIQWLLPTSIDVMAMVQAKDINSRSTVAQSNIFEQAKEMEEINLHLEYMKGWRDGCNNQESVTDDTL